MGYYGIRIVGGCNFGLDSIQMNMTTCYQKPSEVVVSFGRIFFCEIDLCVRLQAGAGDGLRIVYLCDFKQRDRKPPEFRIPLDGISWNLDCWGLLGFV